MTDVIRDLTAGRAFAFFVAALAAGAGAIYVDVPTVRLLVPPATVLVYGLLLLLAQSRFHVSHSYEVKTSPYILGFILTLVALFLLFWRSGTAFTSGNADATLVFSHAGTAILTTVVGLFLRQMLIAFDPDEHRQDEALRSLSQTLRTHATEFDRSQKAFVVLIKEFVGTREQLFRREEEAFQRYVSQIERSAVLAQKANDAARPSVDQLTAEIGNLQKNVTQFRQAIDETTAGATKLGECLTGASAEASRTTQQLADLKETMAGLGSFASTAAAEMRGLGDTTKEYRDTRAQLLQAEVGAVRAHVAEIQQGTDAFRQLHAASGPSLTALSRHLEEWKTTMGNSANATDGFQESLTQAADKGAEVAAHLSEMGNQLAKMGALQERVTESVAAIVGDLAKMDQAVSDVAKLLEKRIRDA